MGFNQPNGRIVINTGPGICDKVDPEHVTGYGFIGDDDVRIYNIGGCTAKINLYRKSLNRLCEVKFE